MLLTTREKHQPGTSTPEFTSISRYCDMQEIAPFLRVLTSGLKSDYQKLHLWDQKWQQLTDSVLQADYNDLKSIHDQLNELEMERFLVTLSVRGLHHSCTHYRDLIATRAMHLVAEEMTVGGHEFPGEISYALISMGSDGREEQTLITDQDYLIVYSDGGGEAADVYFIEFSRILVDRLEQVGFKRCTGDIMPTNQTWRGSYTQWRKRLLSIVRYEFEDYAKNIMDLIVLSDARHVAGDKELADSLVTTIRNMERDYFQVLWGMAKAATEMKLAIGFMKRIWTEGSGEHKGEFNVKLLAWAPLVMNVRILAINQGIPATSTIERIRLLEKDGTLSSAIAHELNTAYQILTKHRILLQIKVIKGIQDDSYHINPYQLPAGEREQLRHSIIKIEELQKLIHTNFNIV